MTKFIIIKKKTIIAIMLSILAISILFFCINYTKNISAFFTLSKPNHIYYYDLDGDGMKDELLYLRLTTIMKSKLKLQIKITFLIVQV